MSYQVNSRSVIAILACGLLMGGLKNALGQEELWRRDATRSASFFGQFILPFDDLDGDGVPDLIVGEPGSNCDSPIAGSSVHLISGRTGAEIDQICDTVYGLGISAAVLDDMDGDGVREIALGAPYYDDPGPGTDAGAVLVLSGATRSEMYQLIGEMSRAQLGMRVVTLDDINGDGFRDFLASSPNYSDQGVGAAYVYSGKTGTLLNHHYGSATNEYLGYSISSLGDVDGDGIRDYSIVAKLSYDNYRGRVTIYSGATFAEITHWEGATNTGFGWSGVYDAGDFDDDGYADLMVTAFDDGDGTGYVHCYSGQTLSESFVLTGDRGNDGFGAPLTKVGDMNSDGYPEFLFAARIDDRVGKDAGVVFLHCGRTFRPLYRFYPEHAPALFGQGLASADLNGDGIPDGVINVFYGPWDPTCGLSGCYSPGWLLAVAGNDLFLQFRKFSLTPGEFVRVDTRGGEPDALTLLVLTEVSGSPLFLPLALSTFDDFGEATFGANAPLDASGLEFTVKAYAQKPGGRGLIDSNEATIAVE